MGLLSFLWGDYDDHCRNQYERQTINQMGRMRERGEFDSWFDLGSATYRSPRDTQRARAKEVGTWHWWHRWAPPVDGHWVTDRQLEDHRHRQNADDGWTVQRDNFFTRRRH